MDGSTRKALPDLTRALELEPKEPEFYYARSKVHANLGRIKLQVKDLTSALKFKITPHYLYARAIAYMDLKKHDDAKADFKMIIQKSPKNRHARNSRVFLEDIVELQK